MVGRLKGLMEDIRTGEKQKREAELAALQAQISPHFLYNALNTIKFMSRMRGAANIEEVASSIIGLLRGVLGNTREFVPLREELDYVNSYIRIQRYKYFQPFLVNLQIEPEALDCVIPKLLLQPLVENAVIHGIGPLSQGGYVSVKAYCGTDGLKLEVTDNGVGMTQEQIEQAMQGHSPDRNHQFSGIGLSNVKERVALLYGEPYDLKIFSEPGVYTTAELLLPIRYEEADKRDQSAIGG
jgi:two-component system sensor histidine kinase YesM